MVKKECRSSMADMVIFGVIMLGILGSLDLVGVDGGPAAFEPEGAESSGSLRETG